MTNTWQDIKNADVVVVMGGNAAEAHPCGFKWVIEAKIEHGAKLVVIDPRFTRTASVADVYIPIRPGTDIAFLNGVIRYLIEKDKLQHEYVRAYSNAGLIVKEGFGFEDGLFTGYDEETRSYDKSSWDYERDDQGFAKVDDSLQNPRCVINLLKKHVDRYTPEMVSRICGTPQDKFLQACELFASCSTPDRALTSLFALGWTQHSVGSQNIRTMAMIQLLLGNIGVLGGGMNALRGHSNIQGLTDIGLLSNLIPGYLTLPKDKQAAFDDYMKANANKPLRPGQVSYWQNYKKFFVSFQKAIYGAAATADNNWAYDWLPKLDIPLYDIIKAFEMMDKGEMNGYICQGFNPLQAFPDQGKIRSALGKLKYLVVMDPLDTETSRFWENFGPHNPSDPAKIETEVFQLPTTCFAEEDGALVNSARWLQWHWKAAPPPGEAQARHLDHGRALPPPARNVSKGRRRLSRSAPQPDLGLRQSGRPQPGGDRQGDERPGARRPQGRFAARRWSRRAVSSTASRNCATTARPCAAAGSSRAATPRPATRWRGATRPIRARPASRRTGRGRGPRTGASSTIAPAPIRRGKPWNPAKSLIEWNGEKWVGLDVPDFVPTTPPSAGVGPFIMQQEGLGRLFALDKMVEGPFPEHYEPFESPSENVLHPKVRNNPAARVFADDRKNFGTRRASSLMSARLIASPSTSTSGPSTR